MKKRKIPMRKDLLSNQMMPKKELVRIVKNKENVVAIDPTGKAAGRGAYVALDPAAVKAAKAKKLIDAAFGITIEPTFYSASDDAKTSRIEFIGFGPPRQSLSHWR